MYMLHLYMQPLHLLYVHAAFTYGASAYHMHHLHAFIYVFVYDVRAICMNFDTNGTPKAILRNCRELDHAPFMCS